MQHGGVVRRDAGRKIVSNRPGALACGVVALIAMLGLTSCSSDENTESATTTIEPAIRPNIQSNAKLAGQGDPLAVIVPEAMDITALRVFLAGDGSPLVRLRDSTAPLAAGTAPTVTECEAVAAELTKLGPPEDLVALAGGIADEPTREIAQNLVGSSARALASCGGTATDSLHELAFDWTLWDRRLQEITA